MADIFGHTSAGHPVTRSTLTNGTLTASFLNYGGILQDLRLAGHDPSLVLGFDNFAAYETERGYFGATVGRYANRIAGGEINIDGDVFYLDKNFRGKHTLHGGHAGTGKQIWKIIEQRSDMVIYGLELPAGHMGFPGTLQIELEWQLCDTASLRAEIRAHTDAPTFCNLAHHSYFNLTGRKSMQGHQLKIQADHYLPVDDEQIPTGQIAAVEHADFDFRSDKALPLQTGLDHNFCLSDRRQPMRPVAWLSADSDITLELRTTEPGLQIYDGQHISTEATGLNGFAYPAFSGLAMEPQIWPDSPHHPHFPNALLRANETYCQQTEFSFSLRQSPASHTPSL